MSFTDLMSSARGPGVIGTVMALIVLLGFGLLFMFAFDEGFQGADQSIEALVRNQGKEVESLAAQVAAGSARLEDAARRNQLARELRDGESRAASQRSDIERLEARVNSLSGELVSAGAGFEDYKDRYRAHVRAAARGSTLERLETLSNEVFEQVIIREVTAVGIQIAHDAGQKRIPFEELPEEMKDYYQFCPIQKEQALAKETEHWERHQNEVATAQDWAEQERREQTEREEAAARERNVRLLQTTETRVKSLEEEIRNLRLAIEEETKKRLSRAPQMRQQLAAKEREKTNLEAQAARLRGGL